jgi:phosphoribosylformylglycinamidine synthase
LISALGQMDDVREAVTMDLKAPGNLLFLVGSTRNELGGSHFALVNGLAGGAVPQVDCEAGLRTFRAVHRAIRSGLVRSCHDLSEGGLAAAVAEMCFAGGLGAELDLAALANASGLSQDAVLLFSESNSRFVVEVPETARQQFLEALAGVPVVELGVVRAWDTLTIRGAGGAPVVDVRWTDLKRAWQTPLAWE